MTSPKINRKIVLHSRPNGAPKADNFRLIDEGVAPIAEGQILLRNLYLSLDPYMRGRMSDGPSYAAPVGIDEVMIGGTVSRVVQSKHKDFKEGDLVSAYGGWQTYAISDGFGVSKIDKTLKRPSLMLGVLGMPSFTAYMGLLDIGQPKSGETVVVAAASGAVGSIVGQIAKIKNCRAVGIAGGAEKCRYVVEDLGFDACIDHNAPDFAKQLKQACPKGIDVYFENVGGDVFKAVMSLINTGARIPVCGMIANYNDTQLPEGPDRLGLLTRMILTKRVKMQGFIIFDDYGHRFGEFYSQMSAWLDAGLIKYREDIVQGLDNAPEAFIGLLTGKNFGKLIVQIDE